MADQLADPGDVGVLLGLGATLDVARAGLLVEISSALVQEASGNQRLIAVEDDEITILGTTDSWLDLPQRPVTAVSEVTLDGAAVALGAPGGASTSYRVHGDRLWRGDGWQAYQLEPSTVVVTCDHGYAAGSWDLEFARAATLGLIRSAYPNPTGAQQVRVDDYAAMYDKLAAAMEASPTLRKALERKYDPAGRVGLVRIG